MGRVNSTSGRPWWQRRTDVIIEDVGRAVVRPPLGELDNDDQERRDVDLVGDVAEGVHLMEGDALRSGDDGIRIVVLTDARCNDGVGGVLLVERGARIALFRCRHRGVRRRR